MSDSLFARSYVKGVNQAPRKVSIVASLVRRRTVADALVILSFTPRRAAKPVIDAIESAKANAINNHGLDAKTLVISTISVTAGPRLKRYIAASRGRALPFERKSSNILVEVTGDFKPKKAAAKSADTAVVKEKKVAETKTTVKKEDK